MSEDQNHHNDTRKLIDRYEMMVANDEAYYFDVDQFEEIIDFYWDQNKVQQAIQAVGYAYSLFPENTDIMLKESQLLAGIGQLTKALSRLKLLEKRDSANQDVLLTMGSIYSQLREHKKAIDYFKKALELAGEEFEDEIFLEIALEYENMDRFDKAIETLEEALRRQPENETLLYELAYCFDVMDRTAESIEYYKSFIDRFPFSFPAWYNLGNAQQKLELLDEALEAYEYCLAIQPDFVPAYYNKAHALFKLERYQEAIQTFEDTYTYEHPQAPVYCHIGECFEKLGELDKALFYYRKSIQTDEFYADSYLGIGVAMDLQGQTAEGIPFIERAVELEPDNPDYQLFLVEMLLKLKKVSEAEAITEMLVTRFPENEDVWMDHADVFFVKGEPKAALDIIDEGWNRNPQSSELGYRKVVYLLATGLKAEAEDLLLRLFRNDPEGLEEVESYYPEISSNLLYLELKRQLPAK
jgi:tetratricopeptide (TPR) repeat protein